MCAEILPRPCPAPHLGHFAETHVARRLSVPDVVHEDRAARVADGEAAAPERVEARHRAGCLLVNLLAELSVVHEVPDPKGEVWGAGVRRRDQALRVLRGRSRGGEDASADDAPEHLILSARCDAPVAEVGERPGGALVGADRLEAGRPNRETPDLQLAWWKVAGLRFSQAAEL